MECPIGLDKIHCRNCYFEKDGACNHEQVTGSAWMRSDCPICGQSFPHKKGYKPVTCGRFDCLQEANKRGLLKEVV